MKKNYCSLKVLIYYFHTIKHLRFIQIFARIYKYFLKSKPDLRIRPSIRGRAGVWISPAQKDPSLVDAEEFVFLNEHGNISDVGWNGGQREKLWRYNQHYFDDLNAKNNFLRARWHQDLLNKWISENMPGQGVGWEPYPTSLRIVNWIKWSLSGNTLSTECLQSLAVQTRWLSKNLEIHLLGNHLFSNAKALIFAGLFFDGVEADKWLKSGLRILESEISEQILSDGGHFELSTMYHSIILNDVLDLCNVFKAYENVFTLDLSKQYAESIKIASLMLTWMQVMCHPDGEISFFNDAAFGVAPHPKDIEKYANRLGIYNQQFNLGDSHVLSETSYIRLQKKDAVAFLDLAKVGPEYLPGHGHADTLTFEFSLFNQRLIVNSGVSCYGLSVERLRQRGTAAHNTVIVNKEDSSEVWGGFRVARRAYPLSPKFNLDKERSLVECSHDGYCRMSGGGIHHRKWTLEKNFFEIEDYLPDITKPSQARFHFHPDITLKISSDLSSGVLIFPNGKNVIFKIDVGKAHIESSSWHPKFGITIPNKCLVIDLINGMSKLTLSWA